MPTPYMDILLMVLMIKFDILGKPEVLRSGFYNYNMVKISISRSALYISQVGHICMLCMCFLEDLDGFESRNKEVHERNRRWSQTKDLKCQWWSPLQYDQEGYMEYVIWSSDKEIMTIWRCSDTKTESSGISNRKVRFSRFRVESE
jgi:hypothetical protein